MAQFICQPQSVRHYYSKYLIALIMIECSEFTLFLSAQISSDAKCMLPQTLVVGDGEYSVCAKQIIMPFGYNNCDNCTLSIQIDGEQPLNLVISGVCNSKSIFINKIMAQLNSEACLNYFHTEECPIRIISTPTNDTVRVEGQAVAGINYSMRFNRKLGYKLGVGDHMWRSPFNISNNGHMNMAYGDEQVLLKCNIVQTSPYDSSNVLALIHAERNMNKTETKYNFLSPYMKQIKSDVYVPVAPGAYNSVKFQICNLDGSQIKYHPNIGPLISVVLHFKKMC